MRSLVFPGDKAKRLKDAPAKRFDFSVRYLPLPGAFKSAAIALRALIREKRKQGAPFDEELAMLYRLACLQDLYDSLLPRILSSGNDPIPRALWETATFDYSRIGYEKLSLLGVQDVRWLEDQLGPPAQHQSVIASEPEILPDLSAFMAESQRRDEEELAARLGPMAAERHRQRMAQRSTSSSRASAKKGGAAQAGTGCVLGLLSLPLDALTAAMRRLG